MTKVKNISPGVRGIRNTEGRLINLEPGQTAEIDLAEGEWADGEQTGWFAFGAAIEESDIAIGNDAETELDRALRRNAELEEEITVLREQIGKFDHDGNGIIGGAKSQADSATPEEIIAALDLLDADNDDHWTAAGLPAVEAVAQITGKAVTRKAIAEAAPNAERPD